MGPKLIENMRTNEIETIGAQISNVMPDWSITSDLGLTMDM